jgi:hypothetical protein
MKPEYRLPFEADRLDQGHCGWSGNDALQALTKALAQTSERLAKAEADAQSYKYRASKAVADSLTARLQNLTKEAEIKRLTETVVALRSECETLRRALRPTDEKNSSHN